MKKLSVLLGAIALLAFAIPSTAFAGNPELTWETSTGSGLKPVPIGTKIFGTGTDVNITSNPLGNITCGKLNLTGSLTVNSGNVVEGSGVEEPEPFQEECANGTNKVKVTSVHVTKLRTSESEKGTASFTSVVDVGELKCTFTGTNVPFTYVTNSDKLVFTKASGVVASPKGCGTVTLDGTFTFEAKNDSGVVVPIIID
jgi:hypothetical protein